MSKTTVSTPDGKYEFEAEDGQVACRRYGEPWVRNFEFGGKAIQALVYHAADLAEQLAEAKAALARLEAAK